MTILGRDLDESINDEQSSRCDMTKYLALENAGCYLLNPRSAYRLYADKS